MPFAMFLLYSFWVPQIWRSAIRGTGTPMDAWYVLGTALGRLALPMCEWAWRVAGGLIAVAQSPSRGVMQAKGTAR
jgi:hypothetical protein